MREEFNVCQIVERKGVRRRGRKRESEDSETTDSTVWMHPKQDVRIERFGGGDSEEVLLGGSKWDDG